MKQIPFKTHFRSKTDIIGASNPPVFSSRKMSGTMLPSDSDAPTIKKIPITVNNLFDGVDEEATALTERRYAKNRLVDKTRLK